MEPIYMLVADLDLQPVESVHPGTSLAQATRALAATRNGLIVIDTQPLSEVTEEDIVEAIASGTPPITHVCELAAGAPQFLRPETSAEDAVAMMIVTGRRSLAVVDEGVPRGLLTLRTAIGALWGGKSWLGAFRVALHVEAS